jgi:hypothetical protein
VSGGRRVGPTYGGYHEPIALDPGLDVIAAALAPDRLDGRACEEACLRDAFVQANEMMWAACEAFTRAFEQELAAGGDRNSVQNCCFPTTVSGGRCRKPRTIVIMASRAGCSASRRR